MKRVVIVGRSAAYRAILRTLIEGEGDLAVVGEADGAQAAVSAVTALKPSLVVVDLSTGTAEPEMLEAIQALMQRAPLPILALAPAGDPLTVGALRRGATDLMPRPIAGEAGAAVALRERLRRVAGVPVIRRTRSLAPVESPLPVAPRAAATARRRPRLIAIAASAGGASAVARILGRLGTDFPACIAVVQHLPNGFAGTYASYLRQSCPLEIAVVTARTPIRAATVFLPADDRHLVAAGGASLEVSDQAPLDGHRPSATVLFRSLASPFGAEAVGVVLSGIGDDGAAGLGEMRARGAITIAQDEQSAAVFGMPRAAIAAGVVDEVLAPDAIADYLLAATQAEVQP